MDDATLARAQKAATALTEGRFDAALKTAKAGLKAAPKQAYLANLAGLALVQLGDAKAAAPYFLMAWRSDPTMVEAPRNLAQALILTGQADKAVEALEKALLSWPKDRDLSYLLASAHHGTGRFDQALGAIETALADAPTSAALYGLRALALEQTGDSVAAKQAFEQAIALDPNDPETRRAYAQFLAVHAHVDAAFEHLAAGLQVAPDHEGLLLQQAGLHQAQGDKAAAQACYATILAQQPAHPLALNGTAFLADASEAAKLQSAIAKAMRSAAVSRETKMLLGFALAHLATLTQQADAPQILAKANTTAAKLMPYEAARADQMQADLLAPFLGSRVNPNTQATTPAPIFIVGLIRSGTTLVEQILARHPTVAALGELARARHLADAQAAGFAQDAAVVEGAPFAKDYRAALPPPPAEATHFVDKMPDNFRVIGYLLNAFPNATVLHMQRDPRDVALSMWANHFPTMAHAYANAMPAMAAHMNHYAGCMQQWRALFPERMHAVSYEELVAAPLTQSQRIACLCGLDWHADMAHPERGTSPVLTASAGQVRQTVHTRSIGKWRTQTAVLKPFVEALDADLWPLDMNA